MYYAGRFRHGILLLLLNLVFLSTIHGFFSKSNTPLRLSSPENPPFGPRTSYRYLNVTFRNALRPPSHDNLSKMYIRRNGGAETVDKSAAKTVLESIRSFCLAIGRILYSIKASAAILAIQVVLRFKMERHVLGVLPPSILIFLLEVSFNNPKVIRSVAKELGERISKEICSFTGKEHYRVGDISKAIVERYTGSEQYHFGDVTRATITRVTGKKVKPFEEAEDDERNQPQAWMLAKVMRGFGTATISSTNRHNKEIESLLYKITGKKEYEFGDVTKALLNRMKEN